MSDLDPRDRVIKTFTGTEIDRIATYDIMHNVSLIEKITGNSYTI